MGKIERKKLERGDTCDILNTLVLLSYLIDFYALFHVYGPFFIIHMPILQKMFICIQNITEIKIFFKESLLNNLENKKTEKPLGLKHTMNGIEKRGGVHPPD